MIGKKIKYFAKNWKLAFHLLFRTKRFGVNNQWWASFDSMWGYSWTKKIWNVVSIVGIIRQYKGMKFRSEWCHFIPDEELDIMGWESKH